MNQNVNKGNIQLDNQSIHVKIMMPSGRLQVTDKISGVVWSMADEHHSGTVTLSSDDKMKQYHLGSTKKNGVPFSQNFYMVRSSSEDDFHDVTLTGHLGESTETKVTIRYVLSTTFPVLNCFCFVSGVECDKVDKIKFPNGFRLPEGKENALFLPKEIENLEEKNRDNFQLWEPEADQNHKVVGAPFFVMIRNQGTSNASGCLGYVQHPLSVLEIKKKTQSREITPSSAHLDETGKSEEQPYHFRFQFFPTDDPEAIAWLYREYLFGMMTDRDQALLN